MKLAPKLLILMVIIVTVAAVCGGWKWGSTPNHTAAVGLYTPAEVNG